jgi:hypothetical protein
MAVYTANCTQKGRVRVPCVPSCDERHAPEEERSFVPTISVPIGIRR